MIIFLVLLGLCAIGFVSAFHDVRRWRHISIDTFSDWLCEHYFVYADLNTVTYEDADVAAGFRRVIDRYSRWHFLPCDKELFVQMCLDYFGVR